MKNLIPFLICFCSSLFIYGQDTDLETSHKFIPRESTSSFEASAHSISASYFTLNSLLAPDNISPFDARRYSLPINLTAISLHNIYGNQGDKVNIIALAKARERYKQERIENADFALRQQKQIQALMQINQAKQDRDKLRFYGNHPRYDGGVRNEAYEEIRQPFINPYYGRGYYGTPFYRGNRLSYPYSRFGGFY